ncbi:hypothetical protein EMIT0P43_10084 [Pseudomonas jessenii]
MHLHRLSRHALAGRGGEFRTTARCSAVLLILLWHLQRRHGRGTDRSHATERAGGRVFTGLQFGHRGVWRFYPSNLDAACPGHGRQGITCLLADVRGGVRIHGNDDSVSSAKSFGSQNRLVPQSPTLATRQSTAGTELISAGNVRQKPANSTVNMRQGLSQKQSSIHS